MELRATSLRACHRNGARAITVLAPQPSVAPALPYRGIKPFRYLDGPIFFGRKEATHRLASLVTVYRGVMLYGMTGAGKSSLLNAGLLATTSTYGLNPERVRLRPQPGQEVEIERIARDEQASEYLPSMFDDLGGDGPRVVISLKEFDARLRTADAAVRPLLIFDQFEEILTLFDEANAEPLRDEVALTLINLLRDPVPLKFVFSFREEYLGRICELLASCPELVDQALRLSSPRGEALPDIIRGPFTLSPPVYVHELSRDLAERVSAALVSQSEAGRVSLSELQTVCLRLWQSPDPKQLFEDRGVQGILEDYLGETLRQMPGAMQAAAVEMLSEMVTSAGTRGVVSGEQLMQRVRPKGKAQRQRYETALARLVDESRLVRRESRRGSVLYELTSEFLVPWISGRRQEIERRRRAARERKVLTAAAVLAALAIVFAVISALALSEKSRLNAETRQATYLGLTAQAQAELNSRPDVAMLLLLAAHHVDPQPGAQDSLLATFQATQRNGTIGVLHGHTDSVQSVAFSPHGATIASAGADGTVRLWSATTHRALGQALHQGGVVFSIAISARGDRIASGGFDDLRVWSATSHALVTSLPVGSVGAVTSLAFRPGSETVLAAGSLTGALELWDTGRRSAQRLPSKVGPIRSVAFSPDGLILAAGGNSGVQLFDVATGRALSTPMAAPGGVVYSVAFARDGQDLATGADREIAVWRLRPLQPVSTLTGDSGIVDSVAFASANLLVSGSGDGSVRLWDTTLHEEVGSPMLGHTAGVTSVAVSPNGATVASASVDRTIRLWSIRAVQEAGAPIADHHNLIRSIAFSPDGKVIASAGLDGRVFLTNVATRATTTAYPVPGPVPVYSLAYSPNGSLIAVGGAQGVIQLLRSSGAPFAALPTHDDSPVYSVTFSPDGRLLASGGGDRMVQLWNVAHRTFVGAMAQTATVWSVAFDRSGRLLASGGDDGTARIWSVATHHEIGPPLIHPNAVFSVAFSADGTKLITGSADENVRLWNVRTDSRLGPPLTGHTSLVRSVALRPKGSIFASGSSDRSVRLWDLHNGSELGAPLLGSNGSVETVAFSSTGLLASAGGDGVVRFWRRVAAPGGFARLQQQVCQLVGQGLSHAEWQEYLPKISYQATCA